MALAGCQSLVPLPAVDVIQTTAALPLGGDGTLAQPRPDADPLAQAATARGAADARQAAWPFPLQQGKPAQPANGAIFKAETFRPLFENHRARMVGDTLTVEISEQLSATQRSTSNIDRTGSVAAGLTALPFLKGTALTRAGAEGSNANSFAGEGSTEASNNFSGTVTATVVHVLPNGHLIVAGEKQIGVNANVDVLRFSGQVDPRAITPGNSVASTLVANVRIEQRGRGQQADVQSMGWLSRFFLNVLPM